MMGLTHAIVGLAFAIPLAVLFPEYSLYIAVAGYLGGIFPDIDLLAGTHRKTLHFPVYYWVATIGSIGLWFGTSSYVALLLVSFCIGAAVHSVMDIAGAGVELRPWERTNSNAVYVHPRQKWARARYWVPYDGCPLDLAIVAVVGAVAFVFYPQQFVSALIIGSIAVAAAYTLIRRKLPDLRLLIEDWLGFYPRFFP